MRKHVLSLFNPACRLELAQFLEGIGLQKTSVNKYDFITEPVGIVLETHFSLGQVLRKPRTRLHTSSGQTPKAHTEFSALNSCLQPHLHPRLHSQPQPQSTMGILDSFEQKAYAMSPLCHIRNMQSKHSIAKQERQLRSDVNGRKLHGIREDNEQDAEEEQEYEQNGSARSRNGSISTSTELGSTGTNTSTCDSSSNSTSDSSGDIRRDNIMVNNGPRDITAGLTAADIQPLTRTFEKVRGCHVGSGRAVTWTGDGSPEIPATQQEDTSKILEADAGNIHAWPAVQDDKSQPTDSSGHGDCQSTDAPGSIILQDGGNTSETAVNKQGNTRRDSDEWNSDVSWPSQRSDYLDGANTSPRAQRFLAVYYARQRQQQQQEQEQQKEASRKKQPPARKSRFIESFEYTAAEAIARHNGDWIEPSVIRDVPLAAASCAQATSTTSRKDNDKASACNGRGLKVKMVSFGTKLSRAILPHKDRKSKKHRGKDVLRSKYKGNGKEEQAAELARLIMGGARGRG